MNSISIVVPTWNEAENVEILIRRLDYVLGSRRIEYELIFVDDHSTDNTYRILHRLANHFPIRIFLKNGTKGKAQALMEGFSQAKYDLIGFIDADLQYPPETFPKMIDLISDKVDIVIAERLPQDVSWLRRTLSGSYRRVFGKLLHGWDCDICTGLKVFKKEIVERIKLFPSAWSFDLEFMNKARNAGYQIVSVPTRFYRRQYGAPKINLISATLQMAADAITLKLLRPDIVPFSPATVAKKGQGFNYKGREFIQHTTLDHSESALYSLSRAQKIFLLIAAELLIAALIINWHTTIVVFIAALTLLYFVDLLFNFYLIYRSFSRPNEIVVKRSDINQVPDSDWPTYTIFCPLYKEWQVLPQLVDALSKLEYPKDKLQVMLLLEENDQETITKVNQYDLPSFFEPIIVPHSYPKTKPKACNYGLKFAKGEYSVIFDAEDVPDPLQLKKAVLAFGQVDRSTVCVQAKLNFYNPHQNILTRVFTAEYSLWFDLVLTGLQSIQAPIPLGGTSNHFRTADLHLLQGWDAFNVTEDCDLGIRLVKRGLKTAILRSVTLEEANSNLINWFWQRTRWVKGYIQTYFVHMRHPRDFVRNWREPHVITFQMIVGGKILSMIINPIMWAVTLSYFLFRPLVGTFIESFYPPPILYMATICIVFGNFLYLYYYMIGCAKRGHYDIIKYVFLVPFYWLGMSAAAWVAIYQFIKSPHYWSKTKHGLHLESANKNAPDLTAANPNFASYELTS